MKNKKFFAVVSALMISLAVGACSSTTPSSSESKSETPSSESSAEPVSSSEVPSSSETPSSSSVAPVHEHEYVWVDEIPATCDEAGVAGHYICTGCDKLFNADKVEVEAIELVIPPQHGELVHHEAKAADYEKEGNIEYWQCPICEDCFDNAEGTGLPLDEDDIVIPKLTRWGYIRDTYYEKTEEPAYEVTETNQYTEVKYINMGSDSLFMTIGGVKSKETFKLEATFDMFSFRLEHGIGFAFSQDNKDYTMMFQMSDFFGDANSRMFTDCYLDGHKAYNLMSDAGIGKVRQTISQADFAKYDGVELVDGTSKAQHEIKLSVKLIKDNVGVKYFVGSKLMYEVSYEELAPKYGELITATTKVSPQITMRGHTTDTKPTKTNILLTKVSELTDVEKEGYILIPSTTNKCTTIAEHYEKGGEYFNLELQKVTLEELTTVNHTYIHHDEIPATCSEDGVKEHYECAVCEKLFNAEKVEVQEEDLVIEAHHTLGNLIPEVPATCEPGVAAHYFCSACGKFFNTEKEEVEEKDLIIPAVHNCGDLVPRVAPECDTPGMAAHYHCADCDKYFDEHMVEKTLQELIIPGGHDFTNLVPQVDPECEKDGMAAHYHCEACGKYWNESKEEVAATSLVIPATGHSYGELIPEVPPTCDTDGMKAHYECGACEQLFNSEKEKVTAKDLAIPAAHKPVHHEATDPTWESAGNIEYWECSVCKNKYDNAECSGDPLTDVTIPKLTHWDGARDLTKGKYSYTESANGTTVSYSEGGAGAIIFTEKGMQEHKTFKYSVSFDSRYFRMENGIGFAWEAGGKKFTFMCQLSDFYDDSSNSRVFTDCYIDGAPVFDFIGAHRAIVRNDIKTTTFGDYPDGIIVNEKPADETHSLTLNVSIVKDASGISYFVGSKLLYSLTYDQINAIEGANFLNVNTLVTPVAVVRAHSTTVASKTIIKSTQLVGNYNELNLNDIRRLSDSGSTQQIEDNEDGSYEVTYTAAGTMRMFVPFEGAPTAKQFVANGVFNSRQIRLDSGFGITWGGEDGKAYTLFFCVLDMLGHSSDKFATDGYVEGNPKGTQYNMNDTANCKTRVDIERADVAKYADGFIYENLDGGEQNHNVDIVISFVKDTEGLKFYIGSTLVLNISYDKINTDYGANFLTADTEVTPVLATRSHTLVVTPSSLTVKSIELNIFG